MTVGIFNHLHVVTMSDNMCDRPGPSGARGAASRRPSQDVGESSFSDTDTDSSWQLDSSFEYSDDSNDLSNISSANIADQSESSVSSEDIPLAKKRAMRRSAKVAPRKKGKALRQKVEPDPKLLKPGQPTPRKCKFVDCPDCGKTLYKYGMKRHQQSCPGRRDPDHLVCGACGAVVTTKSHLIRHYKTFHTPTLPRSILDAKARSDPKIACECGAFVTRMRKHAKVCDLAKVKLGLVEAEVQNGDRHADSDSGKSNVDNQQGDIATSEPDRQGSSSESTDNDEENFVATLEIKFGKKVISNEVVIWVFKRYGHYQFSQLTDVQVRAELYAKEMPKGIKSKMVAVTNDNGSVATINLIKIVYKALKESLRKRNL